MTCESPIPLNFLGSVIQGPPGEIRNNNALLIFSSKLLAEKAAQTLPDDQNIAIQTDESLEGRSTGYIVKTGVLVFTGYVDLTAYAEGQNISAATVTGEVVRYIRDLEIAYNKLGSTLEGTYTHRVDFTAAQTDTASRIVFAFQNIPSGYVFCGFGAFGSLYCLMTLRQVASRNHISRGAVVYAQVSYNGRNYHRAIATADATPQFRMSYFDGTLRTVGETLTDLGFRTCRVAINASPLGVGGFPSTINNGKLIQGNPDNTYFQSSCFWTADRKLHVVPHKEELVEKVVKRWYYNHDAVQSMHFRYVLVKDGELYDLVGNGYTTTTGYSGQPSGRTSIGQKANGDLVLAVIDGNTTAGTGVTVEEMAKFMLSQGCINAMNLDGSGSSTMYVLGELKNSPSDGAERKIPNIIYFQ